MPIDKFSVFNKRKGKSSAEIIQEQQRELKQSRKEEAQRQQGEVAFYGANVDTHPMYQTQDKQKPTSDLNFDAPFDTQASMVELKKSKFQYKDLDITERKKHTQNILNKFKRNVRKFQKEMQEGSQTQVNQSLNGSALNGT